MKPKYEDLLREARDMDRLKRLVDDTIKHMPNVNNLTLTCTDAERNEIRGALKALELVAYWIEDIEK